MLQHWVVLVEGVCAPGELDLAALKRLLQVVRDSSPVALHHTDRCALQLHVEAPSFSEALAVAIARWEHGVRQLGWPEWRLVRAEVLTLQEFLDDCRIAYGEGQADLALAASQGQPAPRVGDDLLRQAMQDQLTGLEEAAVFACRIEHAAGGITEGDSTCALIVLDIDGFSRLDPGRRDELLVAVAARLSSLLGADEKAARLEADRFAVLVEKGSRGAAASLAERIIDALRTPFLLGAHPARGGEPAEVSISTTIGIAVGLAGQSGESLLAEATSALEQAKVTNRGGSTLHGAGADGPRRGPARPVHEGDRDVHAVLHVLQQAVGAAQACRDLAEAVEALLPALSAYTGCRATILHVMDRPQGLVPRSTWCIPPSTSSRGPGHDDRLRAPLDSQIYERLVATRRPQWARETRPRGVIQAGLDPTAGRYGSVVVPVLADEGVVAALEFLLAEGQVPDASVLETLALVGVELGRVAGRGRSSDTGAADRGGEALVGDRRTPASWRYELFGWDPAEPRPSLDEFLVDGADTTGVALGRHLTTTYQLLAGAVGARPTKPAE